jgi:hypothetical protein
MGCELMADLTQKTQGEDLQTAGSEHPMSKREKFLTEILSRHAKELEELQALEEILKALPSPHEGFYFRVRLVSNKG